MNHLQTYLKLIFVLGLNVCFGQEMLPFRKENMNSVFAARGKVLPFMFGHTRIFTATAGIEYRFLKDHSIGVDGIYEWFKTPTYVWDSISKTESKGPFKYFDVKSIHLDYRYYFTFNQLTRRGLFPYVNAFSKFGTRRRWFDEGTVSSSFKSQEEDFQKYGISLGLLLGFGQLKRFGLDLNAGPMYVFDQISRVDHVETGIQTVEYRLNRWSANVRLNFYWYLFRK